jgi:hypothetical protein
MSLCETCVIEEKIHTCCARYPLSGERVSLVLADGRTVLACRELDARGLCRSYDGRPDGCRSFYCDRYASTVRWNLLDRRG